MQERKSILARLLANENISIHYVNHSTASFDVNNRDLFIPLLKDLTKDEWDFFIGHEVSHALNTPQNYMDYIKDYIPFSFYNVVEDIRIERLILLKYPGLVSNFKRAYASLHDNKDFFGLTVKSIGAMDFMSRLNIKAKMRNYIEVPFTDEEKYFHDLAMSVKTFKDVADVVEKIYEWLKLKKDFKTPDIDGVTINGSGDEKCDDDGTLISGNPDDDVFSYINSQKVIEENVENTTEVVHFKQITQNNHDKFIVNAGNNNFNDLKKFKRFRGEIRGYVNSMYTEFLRKKSARRYARSKEHIQGSISPDRLHRYKFDDNIFNTSMVFEDDQSHGVIVLFDLSFSMKSSEIIHDSVKQLIVLTDFFRKANIPFEVYGFNNNGSHKVADNKNYPHFRNSDFHLVKMLDSKMRRKDYEKKLVHLFYSSLYDTWGKYERLNSTPYDFSLIAIKCRIREFKRKFNIQKMNLVTINDGDSTILHHIKVGDEYVNPRKILIDDGIKSYEASLSFEGSITEDVLNAIRMDDVKITQFYILNRTPSKLLVKRYDLFNENYISDFNQKKFIKVLDRAGYDVAYLMNSEILKGSDSKTKQSKKFIAQSFIDNMA